MKSIKAIGKKGLALLMALVLMAGVLPFSVMGAGGDFTVTSQSDLSGLKDALADLEEGERLTVTFQTGLVLDEPLYIKKGDVSFTAGSGAGVRLTLGSGGAFRHIIVDTGNAYIFSMENITLDGGSTGGGLLGINGSVLLEESNIENCVTAGDGGGIEMQSGYLEMNETGLENNSAAGFGGALALLDSASSTPYITNSRFTGNRAEYGGAVYSVRGLDLRHSTVNGNTATGGYGGGIYTGYITVTGGEISGNIAEGDPGDENRRPQGAGIYAWDSANLSNISDYDDISQGDPTLVISGNNFKNVAGLGAGVFTPLLDITQRYHPGGYTQNYDNILFTGNGKQEGEYAGAYAGGAIYSATPDDNAPTSVSLSIYFARFTDNYASAMGGAVFAADKKLDIHDSYFDKNKTGGGSGSTSSPYSAGGALYSSSGAKNDPIIPTRMSDPGPGTQAHKIMDTTFIENASDRGGAVFLNHASGNGNPPVDTRSSFNGPQTDTALSGVTFTRNAATQDGGAIYLANSNTSKLYIGCESFDGYSEESDNRFDGNTASIDGGAIWADPGRKTENLPRVYAGSGTVFSGNGAGKVQDIDESDKTLHRDRIFATDFTYGNYAYSNHDISYWNGEEPVRPTVTYYSGENGIGGPHVDYSATAGDATVVILTPDEAGITPVWDDASGSWYRFAGWETEDNNIVQPGSQLQLQHVNVTLTARWDRLYRIEYYWDEDGDGTYDLVYTDADYYLSDAYFTLWDPSNETPPAGKVFTEWQDTEYALGFLAGGRINPGAIAPYNGYTIRFEAQYDDTAPQSYRLTYHSNEPDGSDRTYDGGLFLENGYLNAAYYSNIFGAPPHGFQFSKWDTNPNGGGDPYWEGSDVAAPAGDLHLYAQWDPMGYGSYYVYYDKNGGEDPYGTLVDDNNGNGYQAGERATVLKNEFQQDSGNVSWYHKSGHDFAGWNSRADGQGDPYDPGDPLLMSADHAILYAQWKVSTYTITYRPNGGTGADLVKGGYEAAETVPLEQNPFTRDDHTFLRWDTKPDGSGDSYGAGADFTMPRANMILYAQWEGPPSETYTITYKANGGKGDDVVKGDYTESESVTLEGNPFTRSRYSFTGWNTQANGNGTSHGAGITFIMPAENVILYAQWKQNTSPGEEYSVYYHANGGEGSLTDTRNPYRAGARVTVLSPNGGSSSAVTVSAAAETAGAIGTATLASSGKITREGYIFLSWNTSPGGRGTSYSPGSTFVIDENTNLYAQWRQIPDPQPPEGEVELELEDHYAYLMGYPDGTVRPGAGITREEAASVFFRLLTEESREKYLQRENAFTDVKSSRWSNTAISTLTNAGILKGYSDGSFKPQKRITRAEFAALVSRFDTREIEDPIVFGDTAGHWAEEEIGRAAALGWIRGKPDGLFAPEQDITRAETATLVNRMLLRLVEDKSSLLHDMKTWPDNKDEQKWYYLDIQEASNSHLYERIGETMIERWLAIIDDIPWSEIEKPAGTKTARQAEPAVQTMQTTAVKAEPASALPTAQTAELSVNSQDSGTVRQTGTDHVAAAGSYAKLKTTAMPAIDFINTRMNRDHPEDEIYEGTVTGTGIAGAEISLYLPGGKILTGTVEADKTWSIAVDAKYIRGNHGTVVGAVQRAAGQKESAMSTRGLYSVIENRLTKGGVGDSRLEGVTEPNARVRLSYTDGQNGVSTEHNTTADLNGNWSLDLPQAITENHYANIWFVAPGFASMDYYYTFS